MTPSARLRILAVDDQPEIRALLDDALSGEGYEVRATGDPVEALRLLHHVSFDAVILDFKLPSMDGIELHRQIALAAPAVAGRCIFISGVSQPKENLDYFYTHGGAYLCKPFRVGDLLQAVRDVLDDPADG